MQKVTLLFINGPSSMDLLTFDLMLILLFQNMGLIISSMELIVEYECFSKLLQTCFMYNSVVRYK